MNKDYWINRLKNLGFHDTYNDEIYMLLDGELDQETIDLLLSSMMKDGWHVTFTCRKSTEISAIREDIFD